MDGNAYGRFAYLLGIGAIFLQPLFDHGSDMIWTRKVSLLNAFPLKQLFSIKSKIFLGSLILLLIGFHVLELSFMDISSCLIYYYLLSWQTSLFAFFRGDKRPQHEGYCIVLTRSLALGMLFLQNQYGELTVHAVFWTFSAMVVAGIVYCLVVGRFYQRTTKQVSVGEVLTESRHLFANQLLWAAYGKIDILIVANWIGELEVGYYHLSIKIIEAAFLLPNTLLIIIYPTTVGYFNTKNNWIDKFNKYLKAISLTSAAVFILSVLALLVLRHQNLITLPIEDNVLLFALFLLPMLIPLAINKYLSDCFIGLQIQNRILNISVISLLINLTLNLVLVTFYGIFGIILSKIISELIMTLLFLLSLNQYKKNSAFT